MKQIALTIEQMKELEALGIDTSDASMFYMYRDNDSLCIVDNDCFEEGDTYTYTLQDILNKLPKGDLGGRKNKLQLTHDCILYEGCDIGGRNCPHCEYGEPLEAAFKMLIWVKKNHYI